MADSFSAIRFAFAPPLHVEDQHPEGGDPESGLHDCLIHLRL